MIAILATEDMREFLACKKELKAKGVRLRDYKRIGMKMLIEVGEPDYERSVAIIKRVKKQHRITR